MYDLCTIKKENKWRMEVKLFPKVIQERITGKRIQTMMRLKTSVR